MENYEKKRYRPKRTDRDRALAQLRGYWEPQDVSSYERDMPNVVQKAPKQLGLEDRFDEARVLESWQELVGEFVARNSRPVSVTRKTLFVQVLHSTVHYELERMKGQILQRIQDEFGKENIRDIRFRLG